MLISINIILISSDFLPINGVCDKILWTLSSMLSGEQEKCGRVNQAVARIAQRNSQIRVVGLLLCLGTDSF
jgi:hypothetical protein